MASRILLVGDPASPTAGIAIKLGLDGYLVQSVSDAEQACALSSWWFPDAIVIALGARPATQFEEARGLRRVHPEVPLVSVYRDEHLIDEEEAEAAGFSLCYPLPLDFREFRLGLEWVIRCTGVHAASHPREEFGDLSLYSARG